MSCYFDPGQRCSAMKPQDAWTIFPAAALLTFAGWVALMVETTDPAVAVLFVAAFLGAAWKACRWWHNDLDEFRAEIKEIEARRQRTSP